MASRREQLGIRDDLPLEIFETPDVPSPPEYDSVEQELESAK
jgi:hypothetical protein